LVRLTQLHGTEQVQEQGDSVQRVADELLDEAAQRKSCFKMSCLGADSWKNDTVKVISLLSVWSINCNNRQLETGKKYASGSVHSWLIGRSGCWGIWTRSENLRNGDHLEVPGVNERTILKRMSRK
jgi:hypothetical protein